MLLKQIYYSFRRKRQRLSKLKRLGKPTFVHVTARFIFPQRIEIGRYCRIGDSCCVDGEGDVEIGDGTILAPHVTILSSSHNYDQHAMLPYDSSDVLSKVTIGRGCWFGWGAMVTPGVTIGDGAVIGMGAVVTKDVEVGSVVVGNPARAVKQRDPAFIRQAVDGESFYLKLLRDEKIARKGRSPTENAQFWIT